MTKQTELEKFEAWKNALDEDEFDFTDELVWSAWQAALASRNEELKDLRAQLAAEQARSKELEEHCRWLASMVENWSDEETARHSTAMQSTPKEALDKVKREVMEECAQIFENELYLMKQTSGFWI